MRSATRGADLSATAGRLSAAASCWFTEEQLARSRAHHRHRGVLLAARDVASLVIPLAFLLGSVADRLLADNGRGHWAAGTLVVVVALEMASVPHRLVLDGAEELRPDPGLGERPRTVKFVPSFVGVTLARLTTVALVAIIGLAVVRRTSWWPLTIWLTALGASVAWAWLGPVVLGPVVDRPVPLDRDDQRARLADLARRAGVPLARVLVARPGITAGEGAYVTGLRRSRRLVIDGGALHGPASEVEVLVAHELGHWRLRHWRGSFAL
ncbi:MAG: endopeptidase, partial [Acidimicrobiia bacterium]|nr:endopeptidase [Acidimicrobiia bacterium]